MPRPPRRRRYRALLAIGALSVLTVSACLHDWEEWLPDEGTGTASATGGGTGTATGVGTGTANGGGGVGGSDIPGTCPEIAGTTELIKVTTVNNTATCVDATEVTKVQYHAWEDPGPATTGQPAFCTWNVTFEPQDSTYPPNVPQEDLPVVGVDWCDAYAYCAAVGKRMCGDMSTNGGNVLPSDFNNPYVSEWHNACTNRGQQSFPYGSEYDADACNGSETGPGETVPTGSTAGCVTPVGVFDLSGNAWEWEYSCSGELGGSDLCKTRGGGYNSLQAELACARDNPTQRDFKSIAVGFRCCADAEL